MSRPRRRVGQQAYPAHALRGGVQSLAGGRIELRAPLLPVRAGGFHHAGLTQVQRGGVGVAQRVLDDAQLARQRGERVVLEVDVADHVVRAAHHVAGKALSQTGATSVYAPPQRLLGRMARGGLDLVGQHGGQLASTMCVSSALMQMGPHQQ